jgi:hypothetical protein
MTVEVRNRPQVIVNADRGFTQWGVGQLPTVVDGECVVGGQFPNKGDHIVGLDASGAVSKHEVTDTNLEDFSWETTRIYDEIARRPSGSPTDDPWPQGDARYAILASLAGQETDLNDLHEPGAWAKAKLATRRATRRTMRLVRLTVIGFLALVVIAAGIVVWYGYSTMKTDRFSAYQNCSVKVGDLEMTGRRTFSYKYTELFGQRFIDNKQTLQSTTLDLKNVAITVVGQYVKTKAINPETGEAPAAEERWWAISADAGERGAPILKGADNYTFVAGPKRVAVIKYEEFCKG